MTDAKTTHPELFAMLTDHADLFNSHLRIMAIENKNILPSDMIKFLAEICICLIAEAHLKIIDPKFIGKEQETIEEFCKIVSKNAYKVYKKTKGQS